MKLPYADAAYIPEEKLSEYLLSSAHPVGRAKARFFRALGFDGSSVQELESQLAGIARSQEVVETEATMFGTKYIIEGKLRSVDGRLAGIRTVWILEPAGTQPRFVTAYPV